MIRNFWGEAPELFRLRLVLKARELRLRGADDRRLRRWAARKWDEFRKRRFFVKCICLGLGYDMVSPNVTKDRNEFCANPAFGLATSTVKVRFRKRKENDSEDQEAEG